MPCFSPSARLLKSCCRLGLLLFFLPLSVGAQSISGSIAGQVTSARGAPVPGAGIIATNSATGRTYPGTTDARGRYAIPEISPGEYTVDAELSGYETGRHTSVVVYVNHQTQENFELRIGPAATVVSVVSRAPMTNMVNATLSAHFIARQVAELPILTRDPDNLALLAPGVSSVQTYSFASTLVPFAVNGSRGRDNDFIIDSVDNNEPLFGGAATQFTNPDIFAEYTVLTGELKAEYGRASGATVNVITKSGSNATHGSLFWFGQSSRFDALNRVEQQAQLAQPSNFYENKFGVTLGGPLQKDQTWYFLSYQWDRAQKNLSDVFPVVSTLPTPQGLAALQALPRTASLQALLGMGSLTNIPAGKSLCFAPSQMNPCFSPANVPVNGSNVPYGAYLDPTGNLFDIRDQQASARIDRRLNDSNDIYGRYLFDDLRTPQTVLAPAGQVGFSDLGLLPDWQEILHERTQSFLLDHRHYWTSAINELRFAYSRFAQGIGAFGLPEAELETLPAATIGDNFGGFGPFSGDFPAAGNRLTLGTGSRPALIHTNVFEGEENFSYERGRNNFKFGADIARTQSNIRDVPDDLGQYFFGVSGQPGGLSAFINEPVLYAGPTNALVVFERFPDILSNASGQVIGQGPEELPLRELSQSYFAQDDLRLKPNLTVNLGLRYELYSQPINEMRRLNPAVPKVAVDNHNLGPRFGFAWSPGSSGKMALRGGYSIMYNPMVMNIPLLIWQSGPVSPFVATDSTGISIVQPNNVYPFSPFALSDLNKSVYGCSSFNQRSIPGTVPIIDCSNEDTVARNLSNPYVQSASISFERAISPDILFEVAGVGTRGTKLFERLDENPFGGYGFYGAGPVGSSALCASYSPANPDVLSAAAPVCLKQRSNNLRGDITEVTNGGMSEYAALQASLTKRISHSRFGDSAFTIAYTWSHMIDTASEIFGPGFRFLPPSDPLNALLLPQALESVEAITPFPQDSNNLRAERGNSSFDRRHRLAASFLWELPFSTHSRAANLLVRGWQLNGITSFQSGQPFTPLNSTPFGPCSDTNGDGNLANDRPDIGNLSAPLSAVAMLADPQCIDPGQGYVDAQGRPIANLSSVHFIQVPLGQNGNAGRNILIGPGFVDQDLSLFKNFAWGDHREIQLRVEAYDLLNTANPGYSIGNVYITNAEATPAFAFGPRTTTARVTGVIPENAINAVADAIGRGGFLSRSFMNTSSRQIQFGVKIIF
ncbi:MAG TPA: TonB-dependent receptor [Terriglobia bacterium]|nr:TonB-dependent receptor [Terriglobia bacterium]